MHMLLFSGLSSITVSRRKPKTVSKRRHNDLAERRVIDGHLMIDSCIEQVNVGEQVVDAIRRTDGEQFTVGPASRTMCKLSTYILRLFSDSGGTIAPAGALAFAVLVKYL